MPATSALRFALFTLMALMLSACAEPPAEVRSLGEVGVLTARLSDTSDTALTGTVRQGALLWDTRSGQLLANLAHAEGANAAVVAAAKSSGSPHVVTAERHNLILWNIERRAAVRNWNTQGVLRSVAIDDRGGRILAGLSTQSAWLIDTRGTLAPAVIPHAAAVGVVQISGDGRIGVTGSDDGMLRVWNLEAGTALWSWSFPAAVASIALSRDGRSIFAAPFHGPGKIWRLDNGQVLVASIGYARGSLSKARFSEDGRELLTGSPSGEITVWSAPSGQRLKQWQIPRPLADRAATNALLDVAFLAGGKQVAAATSNGQLAIWTR